MKPKERKRRRLPDEFMRAWRDFNFGGPESEESVTLDLLNLSEIAETVATRPELEDMVQDVVAFAEIEEMAKINQTAAPESIGVHLAHFMGRPWIEKSLQAVRSADYDFFRRIAKILETEHRDPRESAKTLHFVYLAYIWLYQNPNVDADEITKHEVQTMAKRWWAFSRLKISGGFQDKFDDGREKLIAREIKLFFREPRWQEIWQRREFAGLKDATRGPKPKRGKTKAWKKASQNRRS
ncbi:MAG TPA: hypothetical protein VFO40_02665 [Chthoniobacterales bacterium]|nr:hypothetical protein [Chthoniobacterales bacterium]